MSADRDLVMRWLVRLGRICAAPKDVSLADVQAMVADYVPLLADALPNGAFTEASFGHVAERCTFFPAYAELFGHLRAWWRDNRPYPLALPAPREPDRPQPTEQDLAAVSAAVAECVAALSEAVERKSASARPGATAAPRRVLCHSDELLLVNYRKLAAEDGPSAGAAAVRVAMLERKLADAIPNLRVVPAATLDEIAADRATELAGAAA